MKDKIKEHYRTEFSSSPIEVSEDEINFIINQECKCYSCDKSIFELDDFPKLLIKEEELLCEDCYDEKYRAICPFCEESYDIHEYESDHFILTKESAKELKKVPGIYKILKKPFFYGNILTGFESFFDDSIKLIAPIDINNFKSIDCGNQFQEVDSDKICPDCIDKFTAKSNYIKSNGTPIILIKRFEKKHFADYTINFLKFRRQKLIHERITCRGLIQKANNYEK